MVTLRPDVSRLCSQLEDVWPLQLHSEGGPLLVNESLKIKGWSVKPQCLLYYFYTCETRRLTQRHIRHVDHLWQMVPLLDLARKRFQKYENQYQERTRRLWCWREPWRRMELVWMMKEEVGGADNSAGCKLKVLPLLYVLSPSTFGSWIPLPSFLPSFTLPLYFSMSPLPHFLPHSSIFSNLFFVSLPLCFFLHSVFPSVLRFSPPSALSSSLFPLYFLCLLMIPSGLLLHPVSHNVHSHSTVVDNVVNVVKWNQNKKTWLRCSRTEVTFVTLSL